MALLLMFFSISFLFCNVQHLLVSAVSHSEMVQLPGGKFTMGTDSEDMIRDGEGPSKVVKVQPFLIDKYPVTNENFRKFVRENKFKTDAEKFGWSFSFFSAVPEEVLLKIKQSVQGRISFCFRKTTFMMAAQSLGAVAGLASSVLADPAKISQVQEAINAIDKRGLGLLSLFGLFSEGGGRRNAMSVSNATNHDIEFVKWYLHWGHNKVPPKPYLCSMHQDECLFHNAGSWACTGSSGIITYKLQYQTNLHIMWECPYNFDFHDNYIGLLLSSEYKTPDKYLFKTMFENWSDMIKTPRSGSEYDLVCCGPGNGGSREALGSRPYGHARTCKVQDDHYTVQATMGDRHATSSKIVILNKNEKTY